MNDSKLYEAEVAQTERIGLGDLVIVGALAGLTWFFATIWSFPGLHPAIWQDASVASFTRPMATVTSGYWTAVATVVYKLFGISGAGTVLRLLGHICLAGIAVLIYAVLREWLAFAMRARPQISKRRTFVMRLASAIGATAFVCADPVWTAGQCFSETTLLIVLTLAALEFFFVFLRKGSIRYAYVCAAALGLMTAETSFGFFLLIVLLTVNGIIIKRMPAMESPFFDPTVMEVGKWHLTFLFLVSAVIGVGVNCWTFVSHGGLAANGASAGDLPIRYLLDYWSSLTSAGSLGSWILWLGVCLLPFVVATIKYPSSADEEQFLSYSSGIIFFCCGLIVLCQSSFLPSLWFWTYFPMGSQFLLSLGLFCCAATLALSLTILGVDVLCRDHERLANQVFGLIPMQGEDEDYEGDYSSFGSKSAIFFRRFCVVLVPVLVLGVMIPGRVKRETREMLSIVNEAIGEIVTEAGDASYLFTDGKLDAGIELEAAHRGSPLRCYSLMPARSKYELNLRLRNMKDKEDYLSFEIDSAMGLRSWIRERTDRLNESAALLGFDLWKRDAKALPPMGGVLSRPAGFGTDERRLEYVAKAHDLISRILDIYARSPNLKGCPDSVIRRTFETVQWRLSRMCLYRADALALAGDSEGAVAEEELSNKLNDANAINRELSAMMIKRLEQMQRQPTLREGLQMALQRRDFMMGKAFAEMILKSDPEDPDANFALGMYYQLQGQLARAEQHLRRCLIRRPNNPTYFNNLAMLEIEMGKLEAAESNLKKALAIVPDAAAVLDTKLQLEKAKAARQGGKK